MFKHYVLIILLLAGLAFDGWGQILTFDFAGLAGNEVSATSNFNNAGLTASTITRGTGLTTGTNSDRFNASSFTTSTTLDSADYFQFNVKPSTGKKFSISSIVIKFQRSSTGPMKFALRSSVDNFAANLDAEKSGTDVATTQTFTFTFTASDITTEIYYRFYCYAAEAGTGTGGPGDAAGDDIVVNGTVGDISANSIATGTLSTSPFCVDASNSTTGSITYTLTGTYAATNDFTAYLSDASGSFASETSIGLLENNNANGTVNFTIPANTPTGSGYKIRIKSNDPAVTSGETSAFQIVNGALNVSSPSASNGNAKSVLSWTNPVGCYDEILIVAKTGSQVSASPSGDGSGYSGNLVFGSGSAFDGGFVVYKGSGSPQTITGLTNGTTYHFKFFTRKGTNWSTGETASSTPADQLEAGDIAFLAIQTDDDDQFAFVNLVDIPANQVIYFTDNAWTGSALNSNEGTLTWTAPNSVVAKGTIITITPPSTASLGTVSGSSFALSTSGDQILAYIGTSGNPSGFLSGISSTGWLSSGSVGNSTSYLPSSLAQNSTALGFGSESDNQYFITVSNQGSRNSFLSSIYDESKWTRGDTRFGSLPSWTFTFGSTSTTPTVPSGTSVSVNTGGSTGLSNITFTDVTTGGTVTIDRFNNTPSEHGLDGNVSGYRFIIEPDNSLVFNQGDGYTLRFDISSLPTNFGISELSEGDNTTIRLYKRSTPGTGVPSGPFVMTYHRNGTDGNQSDDYLTSALITTGFSEFFFQSDSEPLPVELTSFTAKSQGTTVNLMWETKTEIDNNGFEVERNSGDTWQKIGFVEGHGTTNSPKYYNFTDKNATGNKIQYRLKQIDNAGTFEYSPVVEVELNPVQFALYQNYPNPFNPSTVIRYAIPAAGVVTIDVFNALGEKVYTLLNGQMEAGYHEVSFDAALLPSGLYFYKISTGDFTSVKKMLLMK